MNTKYYINLCWLVFLIVCTICFSFNKINNNIKEEGKNEEKEVDSTQTYFYIIF